MARSGSGRWPLGLLGMLALIGLSEGLIRRCEPALMAIEVWDWRQAGRAARSPEAQRAAVLLTGDSLIKLGVRPRVLLDVLGADRPAYNLALCAGRAPATYFLLQRALGRGVRPQVVVVDFHDSFLAEPPATTLRLYAEFLQPAELVDLATTMREPDFAAAVGLAQLLPSLRNRAEIRRALSEGLAGQPRGADRQATTNALRHNWRNNLGAQVMPKAPVVIPTDPATFAWVQPHPWQPDPTNATYLDRCLTLAEQHGVPVVWLLPPLHPGLMTRRAVVGYSAQVDRFVAATLARHPGVTVVDGRAAGYDPADYIDLAHLDRDGSHRLSLALGAALRDRLNHPTDPRRVVLLPDAPASQSTRR